MRSLYESIISKSGVGLEESVWKWLVKNVGRILLYKNSSFTFDKELILKNRSTTDLNEIRSELFGKVFTVNKTVNISRKYSLVAFTMTDHPETPFFKFTPANGDQISVTFPGLTDSSQFSIKDTFGKFVKNVNYVSTIIRPTDIHIYKRTLDGLNGHQISIVGMSNTGKEEVWGLNELAGVWDSIFIDEVTIPINAKPSKDVQVLDFIKGVKLNATNMDWLPLSCKKYIHRPAEDRYVDCRYDQDNKVFILTDGRKVPVEIN